MPNRQLVLFALVIMLFWMAQYIYVPILPVYAAAQGASLAVAGLVVASYGFPQLLLRIPLGLASDAWGRRKLFVVAGVIGAGLGALGLAAARNPTLLIVFRGLAGVGASTWVVSMVLFAGYFPADRAVRAAAWASFISAGSQVLASGAGGFLSQNLGWTAPFLVSAALAGAALLVLTGVKEDGGSSVGIDARRLSQILLDPRLLVISLAAAAGQFAIYATTYGFVPIYATNLGASRAELGWLTSAMQLAYMLASMWVGVRVAASNERRFALVGFALIGLSAVAVVASHDVGTLMFTRALHGLGHGLSYPVFLGLAIKYVPGRDRASAMGVFQAIYAVGMFAGPAASGFIADHFGLPAVFWTTAVLILAFSLLLAFVLPGGTAVRRRAALG